jgi:hypothetical protein
VGGFGSQAGGPLAPVPAVGGLRHPVLRGDGNGYYAWLRSPVIDGDLQFENEFRRGDPAFLATTFDAEGELDPSLLTSTGHVRNQWCLGAAILWAPFFLAGHLLVLFGQWFGAGWAADGFSGPYLWLTGLGTAAHAFGGVLLAYRLSRDRLARPGPAALGALVVWGASSLPIYQYFLPFWPFGCGLFVAALLLTVWAAGRGWGLGRWLLLGLLTGLTAIVHPVGVAWALLRRPRFSAWTPAASGSDCGPRGRSELAFS